MSSTGNIGGRNFTEWLGSAGVYRVSIAPDAVEGSAAPSGSF